MKTKAILILCVLMVLCFCGCQPAATEPVDVDETPSEEPTPVDEPEDKNDEEDIADNEEDADVADEEPADTETDVDEEPIEEIEKHSMLGVVDGSAYTNDDLGFSVTLPEGWVFATDDEITALYDLTPEKINEALTSETFQQIPLLYSSQYALSSGTAPNANVNILLTSTPASSIPYDEYFPAAEQMFKQLYEAFGWEAEVSGDPECSLNGMDCIKMSVDIDCGESKMYQEQFNFSGEKYGIVLTITYFGDEDKAVLDSLLESMEFASES